MTDLRASLRGLRTLVQGTAGRRHRRWTVSEGRAHIEVHAIHDPAHATLRTEVKAAIERLEGVDWAEVNAVVGRVVVTFDPASRSPDDLIAAVEEVERSHEVHNERFPDRDHPGDAEPIQRNIFGLVADLGGLGFATAAQVVHLVPIPAEIPGALSLIDAQPRVRQLLEHRLGRSVTDFSLAAANALAQAIGQGPLGLVVDIAHRTSTLSEQQGQRAAWRRREPALVADRDAASHVAVEPAPRPAPLPDGPVERYTDLAAIGSLSAFGVVLGLTRNPRRASTLLLAGIPKAATMGRDCFASQLGRRLADEGVLAMDPTALRRLDRVDTLVLDDAVASSGLWSIDEIVPLADDADISESAARTRSLFDPRDPTRVSSRSSWVLAPLDATSLSVPSGATNRARLLGSARPVLALWKEGALQAFVALVAEPSHLARELVARATNAGLEVITNGATHADQPLAELVSDLQRDGHVVMLISSDGNGLLAADVGLGVEADGVTPWTADLMIGSGLDAAWRVVDAIEVARAVSKRSALFASLGAGTGSIWAFFGPGHSAAQRALIPINASAVLSIVIGWASAVQTNARRPPPPPPQIEWHALEPDDALLRTGSSLTGLVEGERLRRFDQNSWRPARTPVSLTRAAFDELANPLTPLLAVGASLSAAVGSVTDAALVAAVVGANAFVGAAQRVQTERALIRLDARGDRQTRVRIGGDGIEPRSPSALVVGDVIELDVGEIVPADCRLLETAALEVDESAITGESIAVAKSADAVASTIIAERTSMLYEGTAIAAGRAVALVVAVGDQTEMGRSAIVADEPPPSGVEQRLSRLTRLAIPITLAGGAAVTGLGFFYRRPARSAVGTGVSLMVAAIPEGLPALATVAQVASARRLASRGVLVRNPRSIEALGRVDQICFDKTGTLTEGRISLVCVSDGLAEEPAAALSARGRAVLAAALRATPRPNGDSIHPHATDHAVARGAKAAGVEDWHGHGRWVRVHEVPFESARGYHAVFGDGASGDYVAVKGAPESVLPLTTTWRRDDNRMPLHASARQAIESEVERLARRGLRVLAVAERRGAAPPATTNDEPSEIGDLELIGLVGLSDPVRPSAESAVDRLRRAGIRVAMVTGDHPSTAQAIATELGLASDGNLSNETARPHRVLSGPEIDNLTDHALSDIVDDVAVYARVTPAHKVRIVQAYQRAGRAVAMTGDGANDAAAIRLADAGIALGDRANAAARQTADIVVIDDRIETIVDAVIEGRAMWQSVRDAVAILVGGNLGELGFTLFGAALTGAAPINARQLLLVNLLTDMAPALAIALREPRDLSPETLLHSGPDASLGRDLTTQIAIRASATALGATTAWGVARFTGTPGRARTVALAALVGTQLGQTVVAGGRSPLVLGSAVLSAGALVGIIQTPGLSHFFGCRPLGPVAWATAISASTCATGASVVMPWTLRRVAARFQRTVNGLTLPFANDRNTTLEQWLRRAAG